MEFQKIVYRRKDLTLICICDLIIFQKKIYTESYIYKQWNFAIFEVSTQIYEKFVWSRENLKTSSCQGHNSTPEYIKISKSFWYELDFLASVIKSVTAKFFSFLKFQHLITENCLIQGKFEGNIVFRTSFRSRLRKKFEHVLKKSIFFAGQCYRSTNRIIPCMQPV